MKWTIAKLNNKHILDGRVGHPSNEKYVIWHYCARCNENNGKRLLQYYLITRKCSACNLYVDKKTWVTFQLLKWNEK